MSKPFINLLFRSRWSSNKRFKALTPSYVYNNQIKTDDVSPINNSNC